MTTAPSLKAQASDRRTNKTGLQPSSERGEEDEGKSPDLAKAMAEILHFPEDLDGPNNPALLGSVEPVSYEGNGQLQGLVASSSRLFRPPGK